MAAATAGRRLGAGAKILERETHGGNTEAGLGPEVAKSGGNCPRADR